MNEIVVKGFNFIGPHMFPLIEGESIDGNIVSISRNALSQNSYNNIVLKNSTDKSIFIDEKDLQTMLNWSSIQDQENAEYVTMAIYGNGEYLNFDRKIFSDPKTIKLLSTIVPYPLVFSVKNMIRLKNVYDVMEEDSINSSFSLAAAIFSELTQIKESATNILENKNRLPSNLLSFEFSREIVASLISGVNAGEDLVNMSAFTKNNDVYPHGFYSQLVLALLGDVSAAKKVSTSNFIKESMRVIKELPIPAELSVPIITTIFVITFVKSLGIEETDRSKIVESIPYEFIKEEGAFTMESVNKALSTIEFAISKSNSDLSFHTTEEDIPVLIDSSSDLACLIFILAHYFSSITMPQCFIDPDGGILEDERVDVIGASAKVVLGSFINSVRNGISLAKN